MGEPHSAWSASMDAQEAEKIKGFWGFDPD